MLARTQSQDIQMKGKRDDEVKRAEQVGEDKREFLATWVAGGN